MDRDRNWLWVGLALVVAVMALLWSVAAQGQEVSDTEPGLKSFVVVVQSNERQFIKAFWDVLAADERLSDKQRFAAMGLLADGLAECERGYGPLWAKEPIRPAMKEAVKVLLATMRADREAQVALIDDLLADADATPTPTPTPPPTPEPTPEEGG